MTSDQIIAIARITVELFGKHYRIGQLEPEHEQLLLNTYYNRHGMHEQDWQEIAESIR